MGGAFIPRHPKVPCFLGAVLCNKKPPKSMAPLAVLVDHFLATLPALLEKIYIFWELFRRRFLVAWKRLLAFRPPGNPRSSAYKLP